MNNSFSKIFNSSGFSLMEIMVAVGVVGIVSFGSMNLIENQVKMEKHVSSKNEERGILNIARLNLLTAQNCRESLNLVSVPGNVGSIVFVTSAPGVTPVTTREVLVPGRLYGPKRNIRLDNISTRFVTGYTAATAGQKLIFLDLTTTRQAIGTGNDGMTFVNSFLLRVTLNDSNQITDCFSTSNAVAADFAQEFCESTGGSFTAGSCSYLCPAAGLEEDHQITTMACLLSRESNNVTFSGTSFEDTFINLTGDTVQDSLIVNTALSATGQVTTDTRFCVGGTANCRDFTVKACAADNQIARGEIATTGDIDCDPAPFACPSNRYLAEIDGAGNIVCRPVPLDVCGGTNQYISQVNPDGSVTCGTVTGTGAVAAVGGHYIEDISAAGVANYQPDNSLSSITCPDGQVVVGATSGVPICGSIDNSLFDRACPTAGEAIRSIDGAGNLTCVSVSAAATPTPTPTPVATATPTPTPTATSSGFDCPWPAALTNGSGRFFNWTGVTGGTVINRCISQFDSLGIGKTTPPPGLNLNETIELDATECDTDFITPVSGNGRITVRCNAGGIGAVSGTSNCACTGGGL